MESNLLDLSINFIETQKRQIDIANLISEYANGNEEVITLAKKMIKICEKCISIEQNMMNNYEN